MIDLELYEQQIADEIAGVRKHAWIAVMPKMIAELKESRRVIELLKYDIEHNYPHMSVIQLESLKLYDERIGGDVKS